MKILQAVPQDLVEVLYLLKESVSDMNEKGLKHWNSAYPGTDFIVESIKKEVLYIYKDNGIAKGMVVLSTEEPEEYKNIDWQGKGDNVLFIRFLVVHPNWQHTGIASRLIEYAEAYAKDHSFNTIRVDIYSGVEGAEKLCVDKGFNQTGQFHSSFQQTPYFAYEKSL